MAWLTLNRPEKRNALSVEVRDVITNVLETLAADRALKCVVIEARGSTFCAGFDLAEVAVDDPNFQEWG